VKVAQAHMAPAVKFFPSDLRAKFELAEYRDVTAPAVFFRCYSAQDLELIAAHRGPRLLVWMGSDTLNAGLVRKAARLKPCHHVAISSFIARDLASERIAFFRLPAPTSTVWTRCVSWRRAFRTSNSSAVHRTPTPARHWSRSTAPASWDSGWCPIRASQFSG